MNIEQWIAIAKIVFGSAGAVATIKIIFNKYKSYIINKKRKNDLIHTIDSFKNIEQIFNNIIHLGQDYKCSYVHIVAIHNGGKAMNELSEKKITVKTEYRNGPVIPKIKHQWKNRDIDYDWFPLINKVLDNDFVHVENVEKEFEKNTGLRLMYNIHHGTEFYIAKITWISDSLVLLIMQREHQSRKLTIKEKAFLSYKAKEFIRLFSNAKYFLEGKN